MRFVSALIILFLGSALGFSETILVPGPYGGTIQAAVDNSVSGDLILVSPGFYTENIDFKGKGITVKSVDGAWATVIDGNQTGSVVKMVSGEGSHAILDGFILTNGNGTYNADLDAYCGGGVFCHNSKPQILNSIIDGNSRMSDTFVGGAISCLEAFPLIKNNLIMNNAADYGACISCIECSGATVRIENNLFGFNMADEIGGGIDAVEANLEIRSCTFYANECMEMDCGGALNLEDSTAHVTDTIFYENSMISGNDIGLHSENTFSTLDIEYSCVGSHLIYVDSTPTPSVLNWLDGMLDNANPMFFNPGSGVYYLEQDPCQPGVVNPCVDTGSAPAMNLGMHTGWTRSDELPDSGMVDMGYHPGLPALPSLTVDSYLLPETGGTVNFSLDAGTDGKNRNYLVMAGVTGTEPGYPLPGGQATLPINWDIFTDTVLFLANSVTFPGFIGTTDGNGQGTAQIVWPGPSLPGAVGIEMYYAYCLGWPWEFASNPVTVEIAP